MKTIGSLALFAAAATAVQAQDLVVHSCETKTIDTDTQPWSSHPVFDTLIVEPGATLRFKGVNFLRVQVRRGVRIEGVLDVSGEDGRPVRGAGSGWLQEAGGVGGPAAFNGGAGNPRPGTGNARGGDGLGPFTSIVGGFGGQGGEGGFNSSANVDARRAAGGGGARLGADQPVVAMALDPMNLGLVATDGMDGSISAGSAIAGAAQRPRGGVSGPSVFVDTDPRNDFWGRGIDPVTQAVIVGELPNWPGGRGGGGGGDAMMTTSFPVTPWMETGFVQSGAGGGGGGGICIISTPRLEIVGDGVIRSNGGDGARGGCTTSINCVGGGSGGGSGGMIMIQATTIDLRAANPRCLTALGGRGGLGKNGIHDVEAAGGNGGPGIIQLHLVNFPGGVLLPPGRTHRDMSAPTAHVLLPEPILSQ